MGGGGEVHYHRLFQVSEALRKGEGGPCSCFFVIQLADRFWGSPRSFGVESGK